MRMAEYAAERPPEDDRAECARYEYELEQAALLLRSDPNWDQWLTYVETLQ